MIHEIGHNLGLSHSPRWECDSGTNPEDPGASGCDFYEYGSFSSVMGGGPEAAGLDAHQSAGDAGVEAPVPVDVTADTGR